jgi:hypothetical protein
LATYGKVLSALGVGVELSEAQHAVVLAVAVAASLAVSVWRTWRTRRAWPIAVAVVGSCLVLGGHHASTHALEWAGVLVLGVGGLTENALLRRRRSPQLVTND